MCWPKGTFLCVVTRVAQNLVLLVCLLHLKKDIFKRITEDKIPDFNRDVKVKR